MIVRLSCKRGYTYLCTTYNKTFQFKYLPYEYNSQLHCLNCCCSIGPLHWLTYLSCVIIYSSINQNPHLMVWLLPIRIKNLLSKVSTQSIDMFCLSNRQTLIILLKDMATGVINKIKYWLMFNSDFEINWRCNHRSFKLDNEFSYLVIMTFNTCQPKNSFPIKSLLLKVTFRVRKQYRN